MSFSLDRPFQAMTWLLRDMTADDEEGREEESGEKGATDEDGLEGDHGSWRAECRGNRGVSSLVCPL